MSKCIATPCQNEADKAYTVCQFHINNPSHVMPESVMSKLYALLTSPNSGYLRDVESAKQLVVDKYYEVERVSMGQSNTHIYLKDIKGIFNSSQFKFYDGDKKLVDIFKMPEYNPYLRMMGKEQS